MKRRPGKPPKPRRGTSGGSSDLLDRQQRLPFRLAFADLRADFFQGKAPAAKRSEVECMELIGYLGMCCLLWILLILVFGE
jgi:hypothetical protein